LSTAADFAVAHPDRRSRQVVPVILAGWSIGVKSHVWTNHLRDNAAVKQPTDNNAMQQIACWLPFALAAFLALALWQGPQSLAFKPGGAPPRVGRPVERRQ
jgi:hypothetical protein